MTASTGRSFNNLKLEALPGYKELGQWSMLVFFPREGNDFKDLREAMEKLKLNDASLSYEPERSDALGLGFRCGFLGLLHLEVFSRKTS